MSKKSDEQIKYLATLVNTCAASSFTVGVVAPIAAAFHGVQAQGKTSLLAFGGFIWLAAAISLHLSVQRILEASQMTNVQILAYVILPVCIAVGGWIVAFAVNPSHWLRRTGPRDGAASHPVSK